jgi:uncharacterized cupredoxin-like copper-binding protein
MIAATALLVAAVSLVATATSGVAASTTVKVKLSEFKIVPARTQVPAGKVTFVVTNAGKLKHEMVVIRTNLAPGKLPVAGKEASEKGAVGEVADLAPGKTGKVTLTLKPGKYVLICNVKGHYMAGQHIGFRVA